MGLVNACRCGLPALPAHHHHETRTPLLVRRPDLATLPALGSLVAELEVSAA